MENTKGTGRYIVAAISAALFSASVGIMMTSFSFLLKPIIVAYKFPVSGFLLNVTILTILALITMPFYGRFFAKYGIKKISIAAGVVVVATTIYAGFCTSLPSFYISFTFLGLAAGGTNALPASILVNNWFVAKRGTVMGVVLCFASVSGVILGLFLPNFIAANGVKATYFLLAAIYFVLMVLNGIFLVKSKPEECGLKPYGYVERTTNEKTVELAGVPFKTAYKTAQFYVLFIALAISALVIAFTQSMPTHFVNSGLTPAQAGLTVSVLSLVLIFTKILMGALNDRIGIIPTIIGFEVLFVVCMIALYFTNGFSIALIAAVLFAFGQTFIAIVPPLATMQIFGQKEFASIYGILGAATSLGMAVGSPLWGVIADKTGNFKLGFIIGIVIIVVQVILTVYAIKSGRKMLDNNVVSNKA